MTHGIPFLLAALVLTVATPPSLCAQASTVVLVRHAEKAAETGDPELSPVGLTRAEDLKAALAAFPVQAIFVSDYRRTRQTADPTAAFLHLTPVAIAVRGNPQAQATATAAAIRQLAPGTAALVVGHSNTIGPIIEALGGPHIGDLCDAEYATILVLELTPAAPPRLLRASYGVPNPPSALACQRTMRLQSVPRPTAAPRVAAQVDTGAASFPRFDRVLLLETTSETSANASIGDVNGDGNLDLVLAKGRHWPLVDRVLLGDGRGHILSAYNLGETADRSYSGVLVDLNGDSALDVVISNDRPDPKRTYLNDGAGHFHAGTTFGRPEWDTRNASVADVDGDGQPDIIVANRPDHRAGANYVCLNRGKGRFDADCLAFSHESATTITPADFNRDGLVDLVVPHRDSGQSHVYLNAGHASFPNSRRVPFGPPDARIRMVAAADLDRDGFLDLVAIDEARGVAAYFGQRDGTFSSGVEIADGTVTPYALAVSDLSGDGKIDIIVGHVAAPSTIYVNAGDGRHYSPVSFGDAKGAVYGFAIADLDTDGVLDIVVARSDAPNVVYFGAR